MNYRYKFRNTSTAGFNLATGSVDFSPGTFIGMPIAQCALDELARLLPRLARLRRLPAARGCSPRGRRCLQRVPRTCTAPQRPPDASPEASNQMDDDVSTKTNIGEDEMVMTEDNNNNNADYSSKIQEEVTNNNNNETSKEDNDAIAEWEASAKMIAEKVQRQQEGKETAMLPKEHDGKQYPCLWV